MPCERTATLQSDGCSATGLRLGLCSSATSRHYQPCFQELSSHRLHIILLLCPPDSFSFCAPRFRSSPRSQCSCCGRDIAPLPPLHALPFTKRAAPARQKPRYPRSNFTTKTSQCHLQREGGLLEQNARHFKPIRHLPDANPMVERERLY